jgi:DNA primase
VIVCEGYTDTVALHQAGMRNSVGLMGTALTGEQLGELARMAHTVLLALDADSSGQEAMLRASRLAAERKLELRVVALPAGSDPADLLLRDGADAMRALVGESVPFVRFRVQRALEVGDRETPEGRDRIIEELRPVFATLGPSAMRLELTRMVSERLGLPESLAERALADGGGRPPRGAGESRSAAGTSRGGGTRRSEVPDAERAQSRTVLADRGTGTERAFLALCIASPGAGAQALAELEPSEHFTSDVLRRAAEHLRRHLIDPQRELPEGDGDLAALMAELVVEAGRETVRPEMLEVQRLQLDLARMDRAIHRTRSGEEGDVFELARRRVEVQVDLDRAYSRVLDETGAGE